MTTKEIAEAVSKPEQTVKNWVKKTSSKMDQVRAKMDQASHDKKPADYDLEETVAIIEIGLGKNAAALFRENAKNRKEPAAGRNDLQNVLQVKEVSTELEIATMTAKVLGYWKAKADELATKIEMDAPKVEGFDALMRSEQTMSITDAAKHFGLHPRLEVLPYLRECGYLTNKDLPKQTAIDAGYLALRETECPDNTICKQAVVLTSQLETWRTHVIPQIKAWRARYESDI